MTRYTHNQICTTNGEVEIGKQYQYYEDGYVADVTVLSDESDGEGIGFKLRVDRTLRWPGEVGEEFQCWAKRGYYAYGGMWRLHDLGEYIVLRNVVR